jgi:murein DD-endopeptidase MepM/ murein hydrolase activator NlpD
MGGHPWESRAMSTILRNILLAAVSALILAACAASPQPAAHRRGAPVDYRVKTASASASPAHPSRPAPQAKSAPRKAEPRPQVRTAPVITNPGAPSSSPAVVEAAALKPETGPRPGGPLLQPKDDPAQRRIVVQRGDRLGGIAHRYSVNLSVLAAANHLAPPYALDVGKAIYLPAPNIHVVERGETFYAIARRFNVDTRSLSLMNALPRPWIVYPGDEILLPPGADEIGQIAAPAPVSVSARPVHTASPAASPGFIWPVSGPVLRAYGDDAAGEHNDGVDIGADIGVDVRAAAAGEVVYAGDELSGFGNLVLIRHADGWVSAYANAESLLVREGDKVAQGQTIAHAGATGAVSAPQVHFELRRGKSPVDPIQYLPARG